MPLRRLGCRFIGSLFINGGWFLIDTVRIPSLIAIPNDVYQQKDRAINLYNRFRVFPVSLSRCGTLPCMPYIDISLINHKKQLDWTNATAASWAAAPTRYGPAETRCTTPCRPVYCSL
jgi:hypothetical protein